MKSQSIEVETQLPIAGVKRTLQGVFAKADIEPISNGVLDTSDADLQFVAQRHTLSGDWAVQVYVVDEGTHRTVQLVALGDSGLTRAMHGMARTLSLSKSLGIANEAAAALED